MEHAQIDATQAAPALASFTIEPAALGDALAYLSKRIVERRNTIPILSYVAVRADLSGRVTLSGTDLDLQASIVLPAMVQAPGEFAVDASALGDVLAKARKDKAARDVTLIDNGDRVAVMAGRGRYALQRLPIDDFPAIVIDAAPLPVTFDIPAARFLADLAALAPCISKEESRYYLCGVALQVLDLGGRDRFAMIATDGRKIGVASRELPEGAAMLPDCLLPSKAAAALRHAAKLAPTCDALIVEFDPARGGGLFRFTLGAVTVTAKAIDGTFPDWARCWDNQLAPTGEALPMFPELLPAAPLAAMQAIEKALKATIVWEPAADGMNGSVQDDSGLLFGAINMRGTVGLEPVKGYHVTFDADRDAAGRYLTALADQRAGRTVSRDKCRLQLAGGEVLGLTVGDYEIIPGKYEDRPNWETLHVEKVWIEGGRAYEDGAYSEVMPRERAKMRPDVSLEIDGDATVYPLGVKGAAVHLSKDQVRAIVGESAFETMAVEIAGRTVYILQWLFDQGDSRFLTVSANGRTFKGGVIVTRAAVEAALCGKVEPEAATMPKIASPEPARDESAPIAAQDGPEVVEALHGPDMARDEPASETCKLPAPAPVKESLTTAPDLDAITARLDALEQALATLSAVSVDDREITTSPVAVAESPSRDHQAKRTPAHERAIRRAWQERKARRYAQSLARQAENYAHNAAARAERVALDHANQIADMEQRIADWETLQHRTWTESMGHKVKRRAATLRARRLIAAARARADLDRRALEVTSATLSRIKRDMADPMQPERASDIARLVQERDQARTALAAMAARAERAEQGVHAMADRFERLVSRVAKAETALRQSQAA